MDKIILDGRTCSDSDEPVTHTFRQMETEPTLWKITCSGCGETWETKFSPEESAPYKEQILLQFSLRVLSRYPDMDPVKVLEMAATADANDIPWCVECTYWHFPLESHK